MEEKFTPREALTYIPERYRRDPNLYDPESTILNIGSRVEEPYLQKLSNFPRAPFTLDDTTYESVEGFIQGLKFWNEEDQLRTAGEVGFKAKKESKLKLPVDGKTASTKDLIRQGFSAADSEEPVGYVTNYQDIAIPYRSPGHYDLIARAIRAKFDQNPDCKKALLDTRRCQLTHDLGHPESPTTSLPAEVFTTILMQIRQDYQMGELEKGAQKGDITYHLYRYFSGDIRQNNPAFLAVQRLGYKSEAIGWLKSLTGGGLKYGNASQQKRMDKAVEFAKLAGISDVAALAKEAGLVK